MTVSRFTHYWLPVIVYCAVIFIQSSFPTTEKLPSWPFLDKGLHVAAYALLGFLVFRALSTGRLANNPNLSLIISILFAGLYGLSDEWQILRAGAFARGSGRNGRFGRRIFRRRNRVAAVPRRRLNGLTKPPTFCNDYKLEIA